MVMGIVLLYMLFCVLIGIWAAKKQTNMTDFFVAGRKLGPVVVGLAVSSTIMSGFGWVGGFGTMYKTGLHLWTITISATIGTLFAYLYLANPIRVYSEKHNMITITDFFKLRYHSKTTSLVATIGIMCGLVGYLMTNMQALGKVGEALMGVDYNVSLVVGALILAIYCVGGGMLASALTDAFQAVMMVVAALIFIGIALTQGGGFTHINETVGSINPNNLRFWHDVGPYNIIWALGTVVIYVFGVAAQPHVVSKFYQIQRVSKMSTSMVIAVWSYFAVGFAMWAGFAARALTVEGRFPNLLEKTDLVSTTFATTFMHPVIAGLVMGAIMAAIMSTADGIICSISATFTKDIWLTYFDKKEKTPKQELFLSRLWSMVFIVIGFLLVLNPPTVVTWIGNGAWGLLAAVNIPLLVIGIRWKRANKYGAVAASVSAVVISLSMIVAKYGFKVVFPIDFTIIATGCSILVFVIVSLMTKPTDNTIFPTNTEETVTVISTPVRR